MKHIIFFRKCLEILRNPITVILLFIIPIGATTLFGYFFEKNKEKLAVPIAFVDEDDRDFSRLIQERIAEHENIKLIVVPFKEAEKLLLKSEVDSVFVVKQGFQDRLLQQKREGVIEAWVAPSSMATGIVRELIASEVIRLTSNIKAADRVKDLYQSKEIEVEQKDIWDEAYAFTDHQWEPVPLMTVKIEQFNGGNISSAGKEVSPTTSASTRYFGFWTFFTMLSIFVSSSWIVRERRVLFPRIQTTAKGISGYLLHSIASYGLFHILQAVITLAIFEKINISKFDLQTLGLMSLFIFVNMAFSVWLASFFCNRNSYYLMSVFIVLVMGLVGGSFFPVAELSTGLTEISVFLPQSLLLTDLPGFQAQLQVSVGILLSIMLWMSSLWRFNRKNDCH